MAMGFVQVFAGLPLALYLLLCLLPARFAQIGLALGLLQQFAQYMDSLIILRVKHSCLMKRKYKKKKLTVIQVE